MEVRQARPGGGPIVHGFGPAGYIVGDERFAALLMTVAAARAWSPPPLAELTVDALAPILDPRPEFILLGTGDTLARPPRALVHALEALDVGIEPMDSRAAARAWGVLRGEDRQVAAALYPLGA